MSSVASAFSLVGVVATAASARAQDGDALLARAKAAEARRVALVERLAPAVGAFFQGEAVGMGGGSGVLIDPRGYALTNFHVTAVSRVMTVGLNDGKTYRAAVVGIDPGGDIALVKLAGKSVWPYAPLGVSDEVRTGDRVLAMGNPFLLATDFRPTVTEGIVSGVHRFRDAAGGTDLVYGDCIQIDASINPGNSGGPLFDEAGRLIGINGLGGFRPDRGRVNVGVGYAASIDQVRNFLSDLRAGKQCEHGTMDASVRDLPLPESPDVTRPVVDAVVRDSVAWQAGLRLGDILVEFDGTPVHTQNRFLTLISRLPAGRRVTLVIDRPRDDRGYDRRAVSFRLKGIPSGPESGKWQADAKVVEGERAAVLAAHRRARTGKPEAFRRSGTRREGGVATPFTLVVKGTKVRLELGEGAKQRIAATDGSTGWLKAQSVEDMPAEMLDALLGDAIALDALAREGGERGLKELAFTGGEAIGGQLADRIETRDGAGRRRKLYVSVATGALVGIAREEGGRWIEERWLDLETSSGAARPRRIVRVLDQDGMVVSEDEIARTEGHEADDAQFARPADSGSARPESKGGSSPAHPERGTREAGPESKEDER